MADHLDKIEKALKKLIEDNPGRRGGSLYSCYNTLNYNEQYRVYLLGYNPGGKAGTPPNVESLERKENEFVKSLKRENNAYLDEEWQASNKKYEKGKAPLQQRVKQLLEELRFCEPENVCNVCASNLIFFQSQDQSGVKYPDDAEKCWPVHQEIIKSIKPRLFIVFGNGNISPYAFLRNKYFKKNDKEEIIEAGHGQYKIRSFTAEIKYDENDGKSEKVRVIGLPHLSRYSPFGEKKVEAKEKIEKWAKEFSS